MATIKGEAEGSKIGGQTLGRTKKTNDREKKINMQKNKLHERKDHSKEKLGERSL